jgi:tetratricopeptide (TPR) repeat protein
MQLKDYYGAISDGLRTLELDPNYVLAYVSIGISKEELGDLNGACAAWKKAAELGDADADEWVANQCN